MCNPFCQHHSVSVYITEVDVIIFVCLLFLFLRMCVFEGHNLFSSDETCNQSPLIRYLRNTLYIKRPAECPGEF